MIDKPMQFIRWSHESPSGKWSKWHIVDPRRALHTVCGHYYLGAWAEMTNVWCSECRVCNSKKDKR